ncbi:MAG TPA: succinate dehydrogenase, partial [Hyphomicrobiaceae bacterium]|nr:succinate dehydrogenase [Hyphomicrobiaceae bacterium]
MNVRLYVLQRVTAAIMAPLVLGHLAIIFYATSRGLSAAEILGRTRGSIGWAMFYGLFVLAVSVHASIGVRTVAMEWTRIRPREADVLMWGFGVV